MTLDDITRFAISPALELLPPRMDSKGARAMMIAIGRQESRFLHRDQIDQFDAQGPALSYWQNEKNGSVAGIMRHPQTSTIAAEICRRFDIAWEKTAIWTALEYHDVLAAAWNRLLLWTEPAPLPTRHDANEGWRQYLNTWRPGKPHPETWPDFFNEGWRYVG